METTETSDKHFQNQWRNNHTTTAEQSYGTPEMLAALSVSINRFIYIIARSCDHHSYNEVPQAPKPGGRKMRPLNNCRGGHDRKYLSIFGLPLSFAT